MLDSVRDWPRKILVRSRWGSDLYGGWTLVRKGYLESSGWARSHYEGIAVDRLGHPQPWWTLSAIDFIEERLSKDMEVFEYGAGGSTLWLCERVNRVTACEHDSAWYARIASKVPDNGRVLVRALGEKRAYVEAIVTTGRLYDVVVVDGRNRVECAIQAVTALNDHGVLIWDDAQRAQYSRGFAHLHGQGMRRIDFCGVSPGALEKSMTSIFYRDTNCLGI